MNKKDKVITVLLAILIAVCIVALLKKYGSMPVEEAPLWVLWLLS